MTLSIAARCPQTAQLGVVIASSSICVASRCAFVRAGAGAALTQNVTDPRLGLRMLDLAWNGVAAEQAVAATVASTPHAAHRQLGLVDAQGNVAHHTGAKALGRLGAASGAGCVALGNLLANEQVPAAMVAGYAAASGALAERLLAALTAGLDAGGEQGPVRSAGLLVADEVTWPVVDLRMDWGDDPLAGLRELWAEYQPQLASYVTRALNPEEAPSYGVPGDP